MCFSMEASFTAATALIPAGVFCVARARRIDPRLLPLALVPIAFAAQQAAEGCVWCGLAQDNPVLVKQASVVFLFFALAFWPFWVPFSLLIAERRRQSSIALGVMTALSLIWFVFYVAVVLAPGSVLHAHVVHHSIDYGLAGLKGFWNTPPLVRQVTYLAFICGPLLLAELGGSTFQRLFWSSLIAALCVICYLVYSHAFASVWCFFAAISALLLVFVFAKLPQSQPSAMRSGMAREYHAPPALS